MLYAFKCINYQKLEGHQINAFVLQRLINALEYILPKKTILKWVIFGVSPAFSLQHKKVQLERISAFAEPTCEIFGHLVIEKYISKAN